MNNLICQPVFVNFYFYLNAEVPAGYGNHVFILVRLMEGQQAF